jgi:hypothetical protein
MGPHSPQSFDASDEAVVGAWVENPYNSWAVRPTCRLPEAPVDPSSLTRWTGDALHVVICGAGHNICLLLKKLRLFAPVLPTSCMHGWRRTRRQHLSPWARLAENGMVQRRFVS